MKKELKNSVAIFVMLGLIGFLLPGRSFADTQYKQSFSAYLDGMSEVGSTTSQMTGDAIFNVSMDERQIDYSVDLSNGGGITDIVLSCAPAGMNGTQVVSLYHGAAISAGAGVSVGSITQSDIEAGAVVCNPNIHTTSHLIQAMREHSIYINVLTSAYSAGEVRGQLNDSPTSTMPPYNGGQGTTTPPTTGTTTPPTTGTTTPPTTGTTTPPTTGTTTPSNIDSNASSTATTSESSSSTIPSGHRHPITTSSSPDDNGMGGIGNGEVLGASTGPNCGIWTYIKKGWANNLNDVSTLQNFLKTEVNPNLISTGVYDTATQNAVNAFQLKYKSEILAPWVPLGLPSDTTPTGFVYKTTQRKVNNLMCGLNLPMPVLN